MATPFLGQLLLFSGGFAIKGFAMCDGQLLPIQQNPALFSILGTTYGGNGQQNFALPDLRGRVPVHVSNDYSLGASVGTESVSLTVAQIPAHSHALLASSTSTSSSPSGVNYATPLASPRANELFSTAEATSSLNDGVVVPAGGSAPHDNRQPYLTIAFQIALFGIFPARN